MTMILNEERNITKQFSETFCRTMNFTDIEKTYFLILVQYNQSNSESEKSHLLDRLLELRGQQKESIEIKNYNDFLESIFLPKLLVLLSFKDLDRTIHGLSRFLNELPEFVESSLYQLQSMQLASVDQLGQWVSSKKSFKVPKNFGSEALAKYHNQSLNEAISSQKMPSDQRRFRSLLLPLSETDYQNLLTDIESLISKTVAKYDSESLENKRLYKLNLNLYPITEKYLVYTQAHSFETETRLFESENSGDTDVMI